MNKAIILLFFSSVLLAMEQEEPFFSIPINYSSTSINGEKGIIDGEHWESLTDMPEEMLNIIFAYLLSFDDDDKALISFSQTCKKFHYMLGQFIILFPTTLSSMWTSKEFVDALEKLENLENSLASQRKNNPQIRLSKNYVRGIRNIVNAAPYIQYSYLYRKNKGAERLEPFKKLYEIETTKPPGRLRRFLSSIARDRRTLLGLLVGAVIMSSITAFPITKSVVHYNNDFDQALHYARSNDFIKNQLQYGKVHFSQPACFVSCLKDFLWECADLRGYCKNNPADINAFTNFTEGLWNQMRNNCSFVESANLTLDDVKIFFNSIVNASCPTNFFNQASIERIGSGTSLMSQAINYFYCRESSTFYLFTVNAGSWDAHCVAESTVSMSPLLPLWIVLGLSPYALIAAILIFGYCC